MCAHTCSYVALSLCVTPSPHPYAHLCLPMSLYVLMWGSQSVLSGTPMVALVSHRGGGDYQWSYVACVGISGPN